MTLLSLINNRCFHACLLFISERQFFCKPGWKMHRPHPKDFLSFPSYQTIVILIFSLLFLIHPIPPPIKHTLNELTYLISIFTHHKTTLIFAKFPHSSFWDHTKFHTYVKASLTLRRWHVFLYCTWLVKPKLSNTIILSESCDMWISALHGYN